MEVNLNYIVASFINFFTSSLRKENTKPTPHTHDYSYYENQKDYLFEFVEEKNCGYITGQGLGINKGDYLVLSHNSERVQYQVEEIDYYSNPPDMWIALLKPVMSENESF